VFKLTLLKIIATMNIECWASDSLGYAQGLAKLLCKSCFAAA